MDTSKTQTVYERLSIQPFINARGTITTLGGSIMPPQVVEAMAEASKQFVSLNELLDKAGARMSHRHGPGCHRGPSRHRWAARRVHHQPG